MTEKLVKANGVDLCVETFGNQSDQAILLIAGAASSMDWWEDDFCRRLADAGRFVIRYDLRDTGRSTSFEVGAPSYTGEDLLADAVALLAALGVPNAHVVGISMGGGHRATACRPTPRTRHHPYAHVHQPGRAGRSVQSGPATNGRAHRRHVL